MADTRSAFDGLLLLYLAVGTAVSAVVFGYLAYAVVKFRARPGDPEPSWRPKPGEVPPETGSSRTAGILSVLVAIILFSLTINGFAAFDVISRPPEDPDAVTVLVTGFQYGWRFDYPNGNTSYTTMLVPVGRVVHVKVTSSDVFHSFAIPDFRVKADALPHQVNDLWFRADSPGTHAIHCYELCGPGHATMHGEAQVLPSDAFDAWISSYTPSA